MKLSSDNEKGLEMSEKQSFSEHTPKSKILDEAKVFQKVAIATDSGMVAEHFGRCPKFIIVEIENKKIKGKKIIDNPGHSTGFLPKFFSEQDVDCIIAGGAGFRAQQLFNELGIKLIAGAEGNVDDVIEKLLEGKLEGGESFCSPGSGKGYGIEKEDSNHQD